jgi:hypothetical protein
MAVNTTNQKLSTTGSERILVRGTNFGPLDLHQTVHATVGQFAIHNSSMVSRVAFHSMSEGHRM